MTAVGRAADVLYDWGACRAGPWSKEIARALADAGLLITDEDRAVLDAAEEWYGHACAATRTGHPTVDRLIAAIRARREARK